MNLLTAYQKLSVLAPTFFTNEAASILNISTNHAAVILSRLAQQKTVIHLARGRWAYSDAIDPLFFTNYFSLSNDGLRITLFSLVLPWYD